MRPSCATRLAVANRCRIFERRSTRSRARRRGARSACVRSTSRSSRPWRWTTDGSSRCRRAKARRSPRSCRRRSTRSPATASTCSPSTTTWRAATPAGCGPSTRCSGSRWRSSRKAWPPAARRSAYQADVTYITAKEAGFDHLRDLLARRRDDVVHRAFNFALIDEADSILIDEARVPLVIAGSAERPAIVFGAGGADRDRTHRGCPLRPRRVRTRRRAHRGRRRPYRATARLRQPARRDQPAAADRDQLRAARPHAAQARRGLPGPRRTDRHHRRAHRPGGRGPALAGWPSGGARSEGRARPPARWPDSRIDHAPAFHPRLPASCAG